MRAEITDLQEVPPQITEEPEREANEEPVVAEDAANVLETVALKSA